MCHRRRAGRRSAEELIKGGALGEALDCVEEAKLDMADITGRAARGAPEAGTSAIAAVARCALTPLVAAAFQRTHSLFSLLLSLLLPIAACWPCRFVPSWHDWSVACPGCCFPSPFRIRRISHSTVIRSVSEMPPGAPPQGTQSCDQERCGVARGRGIHEQGRPYVRVDTVRPGG